jgi:hypothetical protein
VLLFVLKVPNFDQKFHWEKVFIYFGSILGDFFDKIGRFFTKRLVTLTKTKNRMFLNVNLQKYFTAFASTVTEMLRHCNLLRVCAFSFQKSTFHHAAVTFSKKKPEKPTDFSLPKSKLNQVLI